MENCISTMRSAYHPESASEMIRRGLGLLAQGSRLAVVAAFDRLLERMDERRRFRALLQYDDRMLKDIGLSRADAYRLAHYGKNGGKVGARKP